MRSEQEIYQMLLAIAKEDERIKAVYMNGSRTNQNAPKDIFQDYDIVYVVEETASFISDPAWLCQFGEILYMQYPDEHPNGVSDKENNYGWLMQFADGNRIDLHVETIAHAKANILKDKLCKVLMDKQHILPAVPEASDKDHWVKKPTEDQYLACCNEFWWCSNNLAKGLWREEIPYVQDMANFVVRKQVEKMLSWQIGAMTDYKVSIGKSGKYMNKWLSKEQYEKYLKTYFGGTVEEAWSSILCMCELFEETALKVADENGYIYNLQEARVAKGFLEHVRQLPKDAKEVL